MNGGGGGGGAHPYTQKYGTHARRSLLPPPHTVSARGSGIDRCSACNLSAAAGVAPDSHVTRRRRRRHTADQYARQWLHTYLHTCNQTHGHGNIDHHISHISCKHLSILLSQVPPDCYLSMLIANHRYLYTHTQYYVISLQVHDTPG